MIYSGSDFERRYKLCMGFLKLADDGVLSKDEVWILRQWFGLRSFVWITAEMDMEKNKENAITLINERDGGNLTL
jgi:hypothetical protein